MQRESERFEPPGRGPIERIKALLAGASLPVVVILLIMAIPLAWVVMPVPTLPADTVIADASGRTVALLFKGSNRIPLAKNAIPSVMKNAIVAIEDDTFWIEPDVDPVGILRAAVANLRAGTVLQGGSTLTQQLAKNLYLSQQRTIQRKLVELVYAFKLGARYSKSDILAMYLNDVYFGEGAYGIDAASRVYFGHSATTLSLPEAALLAGLVSAPSYYDPYVNPSAALARRNVVLTRMAALHYISPGAEQNALAAPLGLAGKTPNVNLAPYYTDYVAQELSKIDPTVAKNLWTGGYHITTAMNRAVQNAANNAMTNYLPPATATVGGAPEPQGALVAMNPQNGNIEAMVGGRNYATSQLNRTVDALRQPGSSMKYFLYTTAIANGYPASTIKDSSAACYPAGGGNSYCPHNFGDVYNGPLTMRRAIALSDNVVAVKWMDTLGPPKVIAMAHSMGITSPLSDNLTLALGSSPLSPLEMTTGVSTLANGGYRVTPRAVLSVANTDGHVLYTATPQRQRVISAQVAYVVTQLFTAPLNNASGTAHDLLDFLNGHPAAAKTGTSSSQDDAWLVGYTPTLAASVWVGNDNNTSIHLTGDLGAGPVWGHFMQAALNNTPVVNFQRPPGVIEESICTRTGLLDNGCCTSAPEYFLKGHAPTRVSPGCGSNYNPSSGTGGSSGGTGGGNSGGITGILRSILRGITG